MRIQHMSYEANLAASYTALAAYYSEALGEAPPSGETAPSPYATTGDKISLIAEAEGLPLGRLCGAYDSITNSLRIEMLFVEAVQRGRRIGEALMAEVEAEARAKGVQMIFVDTTSTSAPGFYEKMGFTLMATIDDYPMAGETYFLFRKRLTD